MSTVLTESLKNGLTSLEMISKDEESTGLVFVKSETADYSTNDYNEIIAIEYAAKYEADAVYFRRFDDGRASIPQIYIYDYTSRVIDNEKIAELHRRLWSVGQVPMFFVFTKTEVKIFNCLESPYYDKNNQKLTSSSLEIIKLVSQIEEELEKVKEFSAKQFDNGSFWDHSKYKDRFKLSDSAYEKLLKELKETRKEIIKRKILRADVAQKLLVMAILIKYLEEREDETGKGVFPKDFFSRFANGAENFVGVLKQKGACLPLFDYLSGHFNGEIFKWDDSEEREILQSADLSRFAFFLEGKTEGYQLVLWRLYSFGDLPIELISNIYEEFLESKPGIVYTPPHLVNFLVNECMPIHQPQENFRILDPACGSGVFLVAAYRRIIYWWRIRNDWQKPDLNTLKNLLKDSIFGADNQEEAARLTVFSLSLALCDELSRKVIWDELKFDELIGENIFDKDFFKLKHNGTIKPRFDLVIGNPPFISKLTTLHAQKIEKQRKRERPKLPDNQVALLFLDQAIQLCKSGALLCLVLPSGPFLYNQNGFYFRNWFLQNYDVSQIVDFTALSEILFGSANIATMAIFARNQSFYRKNLLHITIRRTKTAKEKIYFEIDHYDFHLTSYNDALNKRFIWKANLLGGGRLQYLIARLDHLRKFGNYLREKEQKDGWYVSEGFRIGIKEEIDLLKHQKQLDFEKLNYLEKKYSKADFLSGKPTLPTEAFTEQGIDDTKIYTLKEEYFVTTRKEEVFKEPHLLIKEIVGKRSIPVSFRKDYLTFQASIIGIHAPRSQVQELKAIDKRLKDNRIYIFYTAGKSGRYLINKSSSILKNDIDDLPYPKDEKALRLSEIEKILVDDVLDYMLEFRRRGENSTAVRPVNKTQLMQFGETYCQVLNSVYKKFEPHKPIQMASFVCYPFFYSSKPKIEIKTPNEFERYLHGLLVKNDVKANLRITRVLRIYEENTIYLIKPKQIRYWLRSIAVRDADETFADLVKQGG